MFLALHDANDNCSRYRVFAEGRIEVGPSKSLIFWTFPDVLGFFDHSIWAIFHFCTFAAYD